MHELISHLVTPIVSNPDDVAIQVVEGESTIMLELVVNADDQERVRGPEGRTLRAIRSVVSAAAGRRKATLDLVEAFSPVSEE